MSAFDVLRDAIAKGNAARDFHAPHRVVLPLNPSTPGHQERIDDASNWAYSADRIGRSRRTVRAGDEEVIFDFENATDAVECSLRFF